jgi:tricorn protease
LVIDQRGNGGGITPDASVASLLRRPVYRYAFRYGSGYGIPQHPVLGPVALITSGSNFSAAETFALMFKRAQVGPVVGERTGGGGVGGALFYQRLIDGGRLTIPNRAAFDPSLGEWEIENGGVRPDVSVTPSLYEVEARADTVLQAAISAALRARDVKLQARPRLPAYPVHPRREP